MVERADPDRFQRLVGEAETAIHRRFAKLRRFAGLPEQAPGQAAQ